MPNNLVFNTVASELKTQIYGFDGANVQPVATDSNGNLLISGTVTANIATVTAIVESGTITALLSTVTAVVASGTITALLATVTAVVESGTITALVSTVTAITEVSFTETDTAITVSPGATVTALTEDTSTTRTVSFYVQNTAAVQMAAILQEAPTDVEGFYVNDGVATTIAAAAQTILVPSKFLRFTRVLVGSATDTASANVYYNAQS